MTEEFPVQQERDVIRGGWLIAITGLAVVVGALGVLAARLLNAPISGQALPRATSGAAFQSGTPERSLIERSERGLALQAEQRSKLSQYGWADRDAGLARIPIERAIDLRVEQSR
jgi:hypothetical protein